MHTRNSIPPPPCKITIMSCPQSLPAVVVVALLACRTCEVVGQEVAPADSASTESDQLAILAASDSSYSEKLEACKRLVLIGGEQSVGAFVPLLDDEELSHAARIVLEAMSSPAAGQALRQALTETKGERLVGVINSIGARRDPEAIAGLGQLLGDSDPMVASAAANALGKIAGPEAVQLLEQILETTQSACRPAVANALLACAETFTRQDDRESAIAVYDRLRKTELPNQILAAATRGEILTRGAEGADLLAEELAVEDETRFASALGVARELPDTSITDVLITRLPKLPPERQVLLITVIGDRGDVAARPVVLKAAENPLPQVRLAAIRALSTLGDASTMNVLLDAACDADSELAAAALDSLTALPDTSVDVAVGNVIDTSEGGSRRVLVEVAGRRRIVAAVPSLLKAMHDADEKTRLAAIASLGRTVGPQQMHVLTDRLLAPANEQERKVVEESLKAACQRSADKESCAKTLARCFTRASRQVRFFLLELLGSVGGSTALEAVASAALSEDEQTQDVATRVLGQWLSPDAAPVLMEVAEKSPYRKYQVRALRGAIRILRQMDVPDGSRITMCSQGMKLAERDEERVLVLEALGRIPSARALPIVVPYLQTESLKKAACSATVSIAEKIVATEPTAVAEAARQVLQVADDNDLVRRAEELLIQTEARPQQSPSVH